MTEASKVAPSRQELFDELVAAAIGTDEITHSLRQARGVDEHYLRQRCATERTRLWREASEAAYDYDEMARRHDRTTARHPVLAAVREVLTSTPLQHAGALVGLLLVMFAWVVYAPGPLGVVPDQRLLGAAIAVVAAALFARWLAARSRVLRRTQRAVDVFLVPAMAVTAIVLFVLAVVCFVPSDVVQRVHASGQWGEALLILLVVCCVTIPFARTIRESRWEEPHLPPWRRVPPILAARPPAGSVSRWPVGILAATIGVTGVLGDGTTEPAMPVLVVGNPNPGLLDAGLGLIALSALVALTGFPLCPTRLIRRHYVAARRRVSQLLTNTAILPFLRTEINKHTQVLDVEIDVREAPGLGQLSDPAYLVPTAAAARVGKLLESMPGGSIGLAGARGAGKTTLIESYCAGQRRLTGSLATMVSAPVEYAPREFLLHLYAKICQEVIGPQPDLGGLDVSAARRGRGRSRLLVSGLLLLLVGVALTVLYNADVRIPAQIAWALVFLFSGLVLVGSAAGARQGQLPSHGLRGVAAERLEEIRFQQSFSSTWSGAVKVPLGLEATIGGGRGLTRQALHLPEIVDSLRDFLTLAARENPVVIGIDELDKMQSETAAEQFLNEIKSIFGVRGCYFLVSVSEEAMSSFERRGLPFRDVFDSTFDEIVWFEHLSATEAIASIDRRVLLMPAPFKQLCFALSGGLPRELIRAARLVLDAQEPHGPTGLSRLAGDLVAQDVARKARAVGVAVRRIDLEPDVGWFLLKCASVRDAAVDAGTLLRLIDELLPMPRSRAQAESTEPAASTFLKLIGELACFLYYAATVLEYFDESADGARWRDASALHLLAQARQAFSTSTRVAWEGISSFRTSWTMKAIPFPPALEPRYRPVRGSATDEV
ncbi:hypothetical protein ACWED2_42895 [Amycolatopsis sp. NPDC005003]